MVKRRINQDKQDRTSVYILSSLRDKLNLKNGDVVDIDFENDVIVMRLVEEEDIIEDPNMMNWWKSFLKVL